MAEALSVSSGIAARYATALFELAHEEGALEALEADLNSLGDAYSEHADFRQLLHSPLIKRDERASAIAALAARMGLSGLMRNSLGLMAAKRRLFVLPQFIATLRQKLADMRGEVRAEVVSARPLEAEAQKKLGEALSRKAGKGAAVKLELSVDADLIDGMIIRFGSQMIDTSVRSKLARLQATMKEVR